jgi:WhiB family transcriptional regulator, redox-sensing transcriptional regulator
MAETTLTASAQHRPTDRGGGAGRGAPQAFGWQRWAVCRGTGPGIFFPAGTPKLARVDEEQAKALCGSCPVRASCLAFAVEQGEGEGIWGGLTADERRALRVPRPESGPGAR